MRQACKTGRFFTAVVDRESILLAYTEKHTQDFVKKLFGGFRGYLQSDASNVYDILERGPPTDTDTEEKIKLDVGPSGSTMPSLAWVLGRVARRPPTRPRSTATC